MGGDRLHELETKRHPKLGYGGPYPGRMARYDKRWRTLDKWESNAGITAFAGIRSPHCIFTEGSLQTYVYVQCRGLPPPPPRHAIGFLVAGSKFQGRFTPKAGVGGSGRGCAPWTSPTSLSCPRFLLKGSTHSSPPPPPEPEGEREADSPLLRRRWTVKRGASVQAPWVT